MKYHENLVRLTKSHNIDNEVRDRSLKIFEDDELIKILNNYGIDIEIFGSKSVKTSSLPTECFLNVKKNLRLHTLPIIYNTDERQKGLRIKITINNTEYFKIITKDNNFDKLLNM